MMVTWGDLSPDEQNALINITEDMPEVTWNALLNYGLVNMEFAADGSAWEVHTDAGRALLAQATAPQTVTPAAGGGIHPSRVKPGDIPDDIPGEVSDAVALARAQIARLRSALEAIRDYPTVEEDMDTGHQVAGMAMQAEVALDETAPNSGLLTILADKLIAKDAELATLRQRLAAVEAELDKRTAQSLEAYNRAFNTDLPGSLDLNMIIHFFEEGVKKLFNELATVRAERDALLRTLEAIALNAPQTEAQQYDHMRNYAIADSYYTAGKLAASAIKAS